MGNWESEIGNCLIGNWELEIGNRLIGNWESFNWKLGIV